MKKIFYILSAAVVLAAACTREPNPDQSVLTTTEAPSPGDMAEVTFTVTMPEMELVATKAAMAGTPSIATGDLYLAVFGEGTNNTNGLGGNMQNFLKATLTSTITENTTKYEYKVLMPLSDEPLIVDFLVGAMDKDGVAYDLTHLPKMDYESVVLPTMYSLNGEAGYFQRVRIPGVFPAKDADGNYIMANSEDYKAEKVAEMDNVNLIRDFAEITYTATDSAPFTIDGFYLVDTPVAAMVAPYDNVGTLGYKTVYTEAGTNYDAVIDSEYPGYVTSYQLSSGISGKELVEAGTYQFMYERPIPSETTGYAESGAIIKVTWKAGQAPFSGTNYTRYYKVSFVNTTGYMPILRNIAYNFQLKNIEADAHPTTAAAAYAGGFVGDVSANIATANLDEIDNHHSKIVVNQMDFTNIGASKTYDVYFQFYPLSTGTEVVVQSGNSSQGAVTISTTKLDVSGYSNPITNLSTVTVDNTYESGKTWGHFTVTVAGSSTGVQRGKVRVLGQVEGMRSLYREVVFTVMEKQNFATVSGGVDEDGGDRKSVV